MQAQQFPTPAVAPRSADAVDTALAKVRAYTRGTETFSTVEEADEFRAHVLARFDPNGYGTTCVRTGCSVTWRVWGAD